MNLGVSEGSLLSLPVVGVGFCGYFRSGFRGPNAAVFGSTTPIQGHLGDFGVSGTLWGYFLAFPEFVCSGSLGVKGHRKWGNQLYVPLRVQRYQNRFCISRGCRVIKVQIQGFFCLYRGRVTLNMLGHDSGYLELPIELQIVKIREVYLELLT